MRSIGRQCLAVTAVAVMLGASPRQADAGPAGLVEYIETALGGGAYQYDYAIHNLGDPTADAGFDIYDVAFFFSPTTNLLGSAVPAGWDLIAGVGFIDTFSLWPGAAPAGTDVGPGQSLSGFRFTFDAQIGAIPFELVLSNPLDFDNALVLAGQTVAASIDTSTPVPEPATLALLGSGLALAAGRRWQRRKSSAAPAR